MNDKDLEVARASATLIAEGLAGRIPPSMDQVKLMAKAIVVFIDEKQSLRAELNLMQDQLSASEIARKEAEHRRRAAEKDAERWNFVLMKEPYAHNLWQSLPKRIYEDSRHLNAAIDAAIGEQHGA